MQQTPNRHNKAVDVAVRDIRAQVAADGGDPSKVVVNTRIKGASKKGTGNNGFADITYDDGKTIYVWEVKGSVSPAGAVAQGETAVGEVQKYVEFYQTEKRGTREVKPGFALTGPHETIFQGPYGPEYMTVTNGPGPGAIVYLSTRLLPPVPVPAPKTDPVRVPRPGPVAEPGPRPVPYTGTDAPAQPWTPDWKPAAGAGAALGGGAALWWLGKLLSPVCGPLAPACVVAL